jgi:hypothetical protein
MLIFNKYFYKNKKSKLYFGDRVAVLNDFIYQTGGSIDSMGRVWVGSVLMQAVASAARSMIHSFGSSLVAANDKSQTPTRIPVAPNSLPHPPNQHPID